MSESKYIPGRSYKFELSIKGNEINANDISRVQIITSILTPYPTLIIDIFIDANDILLDEIFGQDPCKLRITLLEQSGLPMDLIEFDLMITDIVHPLDTKAQLSTEQQKDRVPLQLTTISRPAFSTLMTMVNKVYEEPKSPREIIEELITDAGGTPKYDTDDENTEKITQTIIPPTTLYRAIKYMDNHFGLFDGVPVYFCDLENNIHVLNISARMKKAQVFTITQLASDMDATKIIEKSTDGKHFYTYYPIESRWGGNTKSAVIAKTLIHIVKPKDTLSHKIEHDLDTIISENSLVFKNKKIDIDSKISNRKKFYIDHSGFEYNESYAKSMIAKKLANLSTIVIQIERNLPVLSLMDVGQPVKFDPKTEEYNALSGMYILKSSHIIFNRSGEWQTTATIQLIRTNKKI